MALKRNIQHQTELLVNEIHDAKNLTSEEKMDYETILLSAQEGTNGLTPEDKLQSVSETVFNIVSLMIAKRLDGSEGGKLQGLYKVLIECKWQICIITGIIATLLIFQPEIAQVITAIMK